MCGCHRYTAAQRICLLCFITQQRHLHANLNVGIGDLWIVNDMQLYIHLFVVYYGRYDRLRLSDAARQAEARKKMGEKTNLISFGRLLHRTEFYCTT